MLTMPKLNFKKLKSQSNGADSGSSSAKKQVSISGFFSPAKPRPPNPPTSTALTAGPKPRATGTPRRPGTASPHVGGAAGRSGRTSSSSTTTSTTSSRTIEVCCVILYHKYVFIADSFSMAK